MCFPAAQSRGHHFAEVVLPSVLREYTGPESDHLAETVAAAGMELISADYYRPDDEAPSAVVLYHGILVHALLRLKTPGSRRLAHHRAQQRVHRLLAHAGIVTPVLEGSCLHEGFELTMLGRAMEFCVATCAWAELIMLASIPVQHYVVGAVSMLIALLMFACVILAVIVIAVASAVTGRSVGRFVVYLNGSNSGMSRRQRRTHLDART